jgi:hypothetical protein
VGTASAEGEALAQQMLVRARMENHVKCLVEEGNLVRRRSKYEAINSFDLTDFPVLTMDDHACSHKHLLCQSLTFCIEA